MDGETEKRIVSELLLCANSLVDLDDSMLALHAQVLPQWSLKGKKKNYLYVLIQFSPGLNKVLLTKVISKWYRIIQARVKWGSWCSANNLVNVA